MTDRWSDEPGGGLGRKLPHPNYLLTAVSMKCRYIYGCVHRYIILSTNFSWGLEGYDIAHS